MNLQNLPQRAASLKKEHQQLFSRLSRMDPRKLDDLVHETHDEVFAVTDCLECAGCCRTLGPRVTEKDIERLSTGLRMKPVKFIEQYLQRDEDDDYVFRNMPCPFLGTDNYCDVYEDRPRACREYPHTDRRRFYQLLPLTRKNIAVCPAVFDIVEKIRKKITGS